MFKSYFVKCLPYFLTLFSLQSFAIDGAVRVVLGQKFQKPANDLINEKKQILTYSQLAQRYNKYKNLSGYSPEENKYWQDQSYSAEDLASLNQMPTDSDTLIYDQKQGAVRELGIYSIYIKPEKNQNLRYGLTFGFQIHASLLKSALLRKVGYYQESPKYLKSVKVKFSSLNEMNDFIDSAFCEKGPSDENVDCLSVEGFKRGFLSNKDENKLTVVVHGAYLEKLNAEVPSLFDGLAPVTENNLEYLASSRTFRSLIVPFSIGDVGESINSYSPIAVAVDLNKMAQINFMNSVYFDRFTTEDDIKFILLRYTRLSDSDWDEIVLAGHYPECAVPLVKSLMLHRYKNFLETFYGVQVATGMIQNQNLIIQDLRSIQTSCVKNGSITSETIPGYPQRFSHGPRKSPFETGDLIKFMKITIQSSVLQSALDLLNVKLKNTQITGQDIVGVMKSPKGLTYLTDTSGYRWGINFNASRVITTGTYYGSQAPLQMVDSVSLSAGIGYQRSIDGLNGINKGRGASGSYIRTFTHVVPIIDMPKAEKVPWANLRVDSKLKELASPLKDGKVKEFLSNLQIGEVFTITDSVGVGASLDWTSSLDALFGFVPGLSAGLAFDYSRQIILRQAQFIRTAEGLQVFIRDINSHTTDRNGKLKANHKQSTNVYGVNFDVNYFANIFKIRGQITDADLHSDAFLLNFNTEDFNQEASNEVKAEHDKKMAASLRALIFQSNVDPLYANFKSNQFEIDHQYNITEIQTKFLFFRNNQMNQEYLVRVGKAEMPSEVDGGKVNNIPITLVAHRKGQLVGYDGFGFAIDATNAYLRNAIPGGLAPILPSGGVNPSQAPYGYANWRVIRTESEITPEDREGRLPSIAMIDHVWSGWSMKRNQVEFVFNQLKKQMQEIKVISVPLIPDGVLASLEKVDFFKLTSHLTLLPEGIQEIKNLVLSPEAKDDKMLKLNFLFKFMKKISETVEFSKALPQDKATFDKFIKILGNGNEEQGKYNYQAQCAITHQQNFSPKMLKGTYYECLEPWLERIINLARKYPESDLKKQNQWLSEILYIIDEQIPQAYLLNYLGENKFVYYVELIGFRVGDENGDDGYYRSNIWGSPNKKVPYANGLFNLISEKSRIVPVEFNKDGGF